MNLLKKLLIPTAAAPLFVGILGFGLLLLLSAGCDPKDDDIGCNITCDRGFQDNCVCVCPLGWEGPRCQHETEPSVMIVQRVRITKMPEFKPNNTFWDNGGLPDLMLRFERETTPNNWVVAITSNNFGGTKMNHNPLTLATFDCQGGCAINRPTNRYRISLYDDDAPINEFTNVDELMGRAIFTPYAAGKKFPGTLRFSSSNNRVDFEIDVSYQW